VFTCLRAHIGEQAVDELHSSVLIEPAGLDQPVVLVRRKTVDLPDVERGFGGHGLMLESQQGLLEGSRLVLDATRVEASAALKSLRAELTLVDDDGEAASQPEPEPERARPLLALAEPRSGSTLNRTASNQTAVSLTDPDAKLRHKPGQRPHLVHRAQVATDPRARCIVAVWAEPCDRERGRGARAVVDRARWSRHRVAELCADQGYASDAAYKTLERKRVTAFVRPQRNMRHTPHGEAAREHCKNPTGRRGGDRPHDPRRRGDL